MNWKTVAAYLPLAGHVLPTLVIGYGVVIPRSCVAGVNEATIGFAASVAGTCIAYVLGVRAAVHLRGRRGRAAS